MSKNTIKIFQIAPTKQKELFSMTTKVCKQCGNEFNLYQNIDGINTNLYRRTICLNCKPYSSNRRINAELKLDNKRQCSKCNEIKDLSHFYFTICKDCYNKSKKLDKERKREIIKSKLSCSNCGYNKCIAALDFHHLNPGEKEIGISQLIKKNCSIEKIEEELKKCIVLCANCHRELHYNERQNEIE